ncbi:MAG: hypothetical protein R6V83_13625 [Candidatus Thorarchaeota archaeon]
MSDVVGETEFLASDTGSKPTAIGMMLAALYAVSALIPLSGFLAATGFTSTISLAIIIAPLFGVILGPVRGSGFGLIAGVLATFVSLAVGGIYLVVPTTILGPAVSGLFTGLARKSVTGIRGIRLPGPAICAVYLFIVVLLYEIPNWTTWWFASPYMLAAVVALGLQFYKKDILTEDDEEPNHWRIALLAFVGTMTDFSMMTIGAVYILAIPPEVFGFAIFPLMLIERSLATVVSSILLVMIFGVFRQDLFFGQNAAES